GREQGRGGAVDVAAGREQRAREGGGRRVVRVDGRGGRRLEAARARRAPGRDAPLGLVAQLRRLAILGRVEQRARGEHERRLVLTALERDARGAHGALALAREPLALLRLDAPEQLRRVRR